MSSENIEPVEEKEQVEVNENQEVDGNIHGETDVEHIESAEAYTKESDKDIKQDDSAQLEPVQQEEIRKEPEPEHLPAQQDAEQKSVELRTPKHRSGDHSTPQLAVASEPLMYEKSKDKFGMLAKSALGSIIDIRQMGISGEVSEKKMVRYANTYKMEAENPFNPEEVDKILRKVMEEALENLTYDVEKCNKQAKWASASIRYRVKRMNFDRYKIVCLVTIGEKHSQDILATCKFLWDAEKDGYAAFALENTYVFGYAQCFGLYYE
nr:tctex1 domain-containing protein 1-B-like [Leptinotarsa decemlineata]